MRRKLVSLLILIALLGILSLPATAATYRFQVPRSIVNLYLNKDGTATIEYFYDFANDNTGSAIDFVDIGLPEEGGYDLASITAEVDGKKITGIGKSNFVKVGVELPLGGNAIRPGKTGQVHVRIGIVRSFFYKADTKESEAYASFNFSPNWFDPDSCRGLTNMTMNVFLPTEVSPQEPRYFPPQNWPGSKDPQTGFDANSGLSYYSWQSTSANSYTQYIFGGAFPARLIPASTIQEKPWIQFNVEDLFLYGFCGCFIFIIGITVYAATVGAKKRKLQYLSPKIAIEGMGIKRGLTAVEAAIVMEQPMDKILSMIMFSVIKKNAASVATKEPLVLKSSDPLPEGLYAYETDFLKAFAEPSISVRRRLLQDMMINLVKTITEKMKGFSRKETIVYYTDIIKKAWEQVEAAETPDIKMQKFDEQIDWTMLDRNFDDRTKDVFRTGPVYIPVWWGRFDPVYHSPGVPSSGSGSLGGGTISIPRPNIPGADFAASVVNGVQNFAGNAVGDLTSFTGGVTNQTNPPPPPSASSGTRSGGSSSGRSCACACACAGCACACAGGGR